MVGYMKVLRSYVYDGSMTNGHTAAVEDGILMARGTGANYTKLVMPAADTTTKLLLKDIVTERNGKVMYHFVVNKLNANYYFVETGRPEEALQGMTPVVHTLDTDGTGYWDTFNSIAYKTPVAFPLRAHELEVGDELYTDAVTGTLAVGTEYGVKADGTIG